MRRRGEEEDEEGKGRRRRERGGREGGRGRGEVISSYSFLSTSGAGVHTLETFRSRERLVTMTRLPHRCTVINVSLSVFHNMELELQT